MRHFFTQPKLIVPLLCLQFIPLILFPPSIFSVTTQDWWLPVLLTVFSVWALLTLVVGHNVQAWPWYLMEFAQGFNIISRMMMIFPHATVISAGKQMFNTPYVLLSLISMFLSAIFLTYLEMPEVRMTVVRR